MIFQTFTYQIIADYFKLRQIKKGSEGIGKDEVGSSNLPSSSNLIPLKSYNFKGIFFFIRTFFTNMYFSKIGHFRRNPHRNPHGFFFRTEKKLPWRKIPIRQGVVYARSSAFLKILEALFLLSSLACA